MTDDDDGSAMLRGFVREVLVDRTRVERPDAYPFSIPAVAALDRLPLDPRVTFFVGENGSGKSTLVEAIAVACGMNAEGGSKNMRFSTRSSESPLHRALRVALGAQRSHGGGSLHEMSHGESFMRLVLERFFGRGLYILDEPEAALSPSRQLSLLRAMHELVVGGSQFVIATHSPILLAFPEATIYLLGPNGIEKTRYEDTEHFRLTRDFLGDHARYLRRLFAD